MLSSSANVNESKSSTKLSINHSLLYKQCDKRRIFVDLLQEKYDYLKQHCLFNGVALVPAASMLLIINEMEIFSPNNKINNFYDAFFLVPLIISNADDLAITINWNTNNQCAEIRSSQKSNQVVFSSKMKNESDQISLERSINFSFVLNSQEENKIKIEKKNFYEFMKFHNYDFSQMFCSVTKINIIDSFEENKLITYGTGIIENSQHLDIIIDGGFQCMVYALLHHFKKSNTEVLVPFAINHAQFCKTDRILENKIQAVAIFKVYHKLLSGDCIINIKGKTIFVVKNIQFRTIEQSSLAILKEITPTYSKIKQDEKLKYGIRSVACRLPGNINSLDDFWKGLKNGLVTDTRIPASRIPTRNNLLKNRLVEGGNFLKQNISAFDAQFFGISRAEAEAMDPQQRILLECVYECMENGGYKSFKGKVGVFIGLMSIEYAEIAECANKRDILSMLGSASSIVAGRLNHLFDASGPSITIDTACSSSLTCIDLAVQSLECGRCKKAIVAGVNLTLTEKGLQQRANGNMLSWDGVCRTFDEHASGYGRSDGCVALLIEKITNNSKFEAVIESINVNHDGKSTALTAPNPNAQKNLILKCLKTVSTDKELLFWECHGTGTPLGDPIEYFALKNALSSLNKKQKNEVYISSAKANVGHCEAASGLVGVMKAIVQLKYSYIPRLPRFHLLNKQIKENIADFLKIPVCGVDIKKNGVGGVSSFGISGTNACVILSSPPLNKNQTSSSLNHDYINVLPISAKSINSLIQNKNHFLNLLTLNTEITKKLFVTSFCKSAAINRNHYQYRNAIVFESLGGKLKPKIFEKSDAKTLGFAFILDYWPEFNIELLLKIYSYAKFFKNAIDVLELKMTEIFKNANKKMLLAIDVYSKFQTLIEFGVRPTKLIIINDKHSKILQSILQEPLTQKSKPLFMQYANQIRLNDKKNQNLTKLEGKYNFIGYRSLNFSMNSVREFEQLIAVAFVSGEEINWNAIYLNQNFSKINLPNYSFDRKVMWIVKTLMEFDHPLLGNIIEENVDHTYFENLLSINRLPLINFVKHKNEKILPFSAVFEMIIGAAWTQCREEDSLCIQKINLQKINKIEANEFWILTKLFKQTKQIQVINTENNSILCSAMFAQISASNIKQNKFPKVFQKIDGKQFKSQILNCTNVKYNDIIDTDIFLDFACNVVKISTNQNVVDQNTVINPIILEAFAQLLLHHGTVNKYDDIFLKIKEIQVHGKLSNECYININDEIIEVFNESGKLILKFILYLTTPKAVVLVEKPIKKLIQMSNVFEKHFTNNIDANKIIDKIRHALEDSLSLETPLNDNCYDIGFIDLGLDSLSLVGFLSKLKYEYFADIEISSTDLFSNPNINSLTLHIIKKLQLLQDRNKTLITQPELMLLNQPTSSVSNNCKPLNELSEQSFFQENDQNFHAYYIESLPNLFNKDIEIIISAENDVIITYLINNKIKKLKADNYFNLFQKFFNKLNKNFKKSVIIFFSIIDNNMTIRQITEILLSFANCINRCANLPKLLISVENKKYGEILNGFSKGFFKSLAAEKPDKMKFINNFCLKRLKTLSVLFPNPVPCGAWLITGGTSGIGFEMAHYLALNYNVTFIALVARNPIKKNIKSRLQEMKQFCKVEVFQADVSIIEDMQYLFKTIQSKLTNNELEGIIHSAGCIRDSLIEFQTLSTFYDVAQAKCTGIQNINKCLLDFGNSPKFFFFNSSISSLLGNAAQTNYSAANAYCDEFIADRRKKKLSGTTIYWGNWLETGMAERTGVNVLLQELGLTGMDNNEAMQYFKFILETNPEHLVVAKINWEKLFKNRMDLQSNLIDNLNDFNNSNVNNKKKKLEETDINDDFIFKINTINELKLYLVQKLAKYFPCNNNKNQQATDEITGFIDLGFDSLNMYLLATDLTKEISKFTNNTNFSISVMDLFEYPTIEKLAKQIWHRLNYITEKNEMQDCNDKKKTQAIITISNLNFEIISQHKIENDIVVPAAFQIRQFENYYIIKCFASKEISLKNIIFQNKIDLHNLEHITIQDNDQNNGKSVRLINPENKIEFSSCFITQNSLYKISDKINNFVLNLKLSNANKYDETEFYEKSERNGIFYGEMFRCLKNIWIENDFVKADVVINSSHKNFFTNSWIFYDLAFQALSVVLLEPNSSAYYVPIHINTFWRSLNFDISQILSLEIYGQVTERQKTLVKGTLVIRLNKQNIIFIDDLTAIRAQNCFTNCSHKRKNAILSENEVYNARKISNNQTICNFYENSKENKSKTIKILIRGWSQKLKKNLEKNFKKPLVEKDFKRFDAEFFNITPKEAPFIDPQQRWLLEAAVEAMESAQITKFPENTGVFVGSSSCDFTQKTFSELRDVSSYLATGTNSSFLSGRLAHYFGVTGPVETVDTACSSFSVALARACDALILQHCKFAIVGAVNVMLNKKTSEVLNKLGVLSAKNRCATFDSDADGYLRSNGVGVIILQGFYNQTDDLCYSVFNQNLKIQIKGWSVGHAGNHAASLTASSSIVQTRIIKNALRQANVNKIDLIECHGSATVLGDPVEVFSVLQSFPSNNYITMTASKTKCGHSEAAAGVTALIDVLESLVKQRVEPIRHFHNLNPQIRTLSGSEKIILPIVGMELNIKNSMINSFGFSGTNACVILSCKKTKNDFALTETDITTSEIFILTAKSAESISMLKKTFNKYIEGKNYCELKNICQQLQHTRIHYSQNRYAEIIDFVNMTRTKIEPKKNFNKKLIFAIDSVENATLCLLELYNNHSGFRTSCQQMTFEISLNDDYILALLMTNFLLNCKLPIEQLVFFDKNMKNTFEKHYPLIYKSVHLDSIKQNSTLVHLSKILCNEEFKIRPSYALNRFFGENFIANFPFDFTVFNPPRRNMKCYNIPRYCFNQKKYWPFQSKIVKPTAKKKDVASQSKIYKVDYELFQSTYLNKNTKEMFFVLDFVNCKFPFEQLPNYYNHIQDTENVNVQIRNDSTTFIIVWNSMASQDAIIKDILCLSRLIINIDRKIILKLLVLTQYQGAIRSEISVFIRSAAAEFTNIAYRVVHLEDWNISDNFSQTAKLINNQLTDLENLLLSECLILLKNGNLMVERMQSVKNINLIKQTSKKNSKVLITGGNGGLGQELIKTIDAEELILISRCSKQLEQVKSVQGKRIRSYNANCGNIDEMRQIFLKESGICAIYHCAGVVKNDRLENLLAQSYKDVFEAKVTGTINLLKMCNEFNIQSFTSISSIAADLGFIGQANYAVANVLMSKYCYHYSMNNSNIKINVKSLGPFFDVGMLAGDDKIQIRKQIRDSGWNFLDIRKVAEFVVSEIGNDSFNQYSLFSANWLEMQKQQKHLLGFTKYCINNSWTISKLANQKNSNYSIINKTNVQENLKKIKQKIQNCIYEVSGLQDIQPDVGLMSIGLDSMMIEELRNKIYSKFKFKLTVTEMYEFVCVNDLSDLILSKQNLNDDKMLEKNNKTQQNLNLKDFEHNGYILNKNNVQPIFKKKLHGLKRHTSNSMLMENYIPNLKISSKKKAKTELTVNNISQKNVEVVQTKFNEKKKTVLPSKQILRKLNFENEYKNTQNPTSNYISYKENKKYLNSSDLSNYNKFVNRDDIAIIAISGSFSGTESIESLWAALLEGKELFTKCSSNNDEVNDYDDNDIDMQQCKTFVNASGVVPHCDEFDDKLFSLSNEDIKMLDPQVRITLLHAYLALEKSGYLPKRSTLKIGCFVGAEPSAFPESKIKQNINLHGSLIEMYRKNQKDFISMWISHILNLNGPSCAVYSACSSSLLACQQAATSLIKNDLDLCLAGAVHLVPPSEIGHDFVPGMVLSASPHCRPFSQSKKGGIIRGSGCSILVLKLATKAIQDNNNILGIIKSCFINNDGGLSNKSNFMAPSVKGQRQSIAGAFINAKHIEPLDIAYLECHATGTVVGDEIELKAISDVFATITDKTKNIKPLLIGSIKANIGHAFAASGMASIAKCLKILETKFIPPQLALLNSSKNMNESYQNLEVVFGKVRNVVLETSKPMYVMLNSFGIGGTNASMILMEGPNRFLKNKKCLAQQPNAKKPMIAGKCVILPISGASIFSCIANCKALAEYIKNKIKKLQHITYKTKNMNEETKAIQNIAYTLQNCRQFYSYRVAIVVESLKTAYIQLQSVTEKDVKMTNTVNNENLAMFFCPQGVQYPEMLKYEQTKSKYLQNILTKYCKYFDEDVEKLKKILQSDEVNDVKFTQCALFAICCTISEFLKSAVELENIKIFFGHSLGEYSALAEAEILDKKDCMKLLLIRGELMKRTASTKMIMVHGPSKSIKIPDDLQVSAILNSNIKVYVGPPKSVDFFKDYLTHCKIECKILKSSHGFHSTFLSPICKMFATNLSKILNFEKLNSPENLLKCAKIISNIDGKYLSDRKFNVEYLCEHMLNPVRLDSSIETLISNLAINTVIEIGPPGMLENLIQLNLSDKNRSINVVHTMLTRWDAIKNDHSALFEAIGKLWCIGYKVNFVKLFGSSPLIDYNMPGYQLHFKNFALESNNLTANINQQHQVYQQRWKLVEDMALHTNSVPVSTEYKTVLLMTNAKNTSYEHFEKYFNICNTHVYTLQLKSDKKLLCYESSLNKFKVAVNEQSFKKIQNFITKKPNLVLIYYEDIKENDVGTTNNNLLFSFTALHMFHRFITIANDSILLAFCGSQNSQFFPILFGPLSEMKNINIKQFSMIEILDNEFCHYLSPLMNLLLSKNFNLNKGFERYKLKNGLLLQMFYEAKLTNNNILQLKNSNLSTKMTKSKYCILFGGTGSIGLIFAKLIQKNFPKIKILIVSRTATSKADNLKKKISNVSFFDVDIADSSQVDLFFHQIKRLGKCKYIIHCAGLPPLSESKENKKNNTVFLAKIYGTLNILTSLRKAEISVMSIILNSSLTAVNGLPGAGDYASANIFLDSIAELNNTVKLVSNIVSIQWPAWSDSQMFQTSKLVNNKYIVENAIDYKSAAKIIQKIISEPIQNSTFAVAKMNPIKMRSYFASQFVKDRVTNAKQKTMCKNDVKLNFKQILMELWTDSLPKIKFKKSNQTSSLVLENSDNFFNLGGNSLNGIQLIWRCEQALKIPMLKISVNWLFENPMFGDFCQKIENEINLAVSNQKLYSDEILQCDLKTNIPLSLQQEQMWILWNLSNENTKKNGLYNVVFKISLHGEDLNLAGVEYALRSLFAKQTSLRTSFTMHNVIQPFQQILSLTESFIFLNWNEVANDDVVHLMEAEEKAFNFPLTELPLRIRSFKQLKFGSPIFIILNHHHILTDGWSMTIFAKEFSYFYKKFKASSKLSVISLQNKIIDKPIKQITYADFSVWSRKNYNETIKKTKCKEFANKLKQFPAGGSFLVRDFEAHGNLIAELYESVTLNIENTLKDDLDNFCFSQQTTRYIALLTAFARVIDIWREDNIDRKTPIIIGCPVSGRSNRQLSEIIGYFLNNIILNIEPAYLWNNNKKSSITFIQKCVNDANYYSDVPFHKVVAVLTDKRQVIDGENPVFQIFFNYRHNLDFPVVELDSSNIHSAIEQISSNKVFQLSCTIDEITLPAGSESIRILFDYDSFLYKKETIQSFAADFVTQIQSLVCTEANVNKPQIQSTDLQVHKSNFNQHSSCLFNKATSVGEVLYVPPNLGIMDVIQRQCDKFPNNDAILRLFSKEDALNQLTYFHLMEIVKKNAIFIQTKFFEVVGTTVISDTVIPLIFEDNNMSILWILSVLEIGAAYSIISAKMPQLRTCLLLNELNCCFALADFDLQIPKFCVINVNTSGKVETQYLKQFKTRKQCIGQQLAYVCFTSGTTGTPKGVCIENKNVISFINGATKQFDIDKNSKIGHSVNCSFDVSVFNIFASLMNGACLIQLDSIMQFVEPIPVQMTSKISNLKESTLRNIDSQKVMENIRMRQTAVKSNRIFTHLFITSAIFNSLTDIELEFLSKHATDRLLVGGETPNECSLQKCRKFVALTQIYGPTETTVWSLCQEMNQKPLDSTIIGFPCHNESIFLLSCISSKEELIDRLVPLSKHSLAVGELCIGGEGVARGYLKSSDPHKYIEIPKLGRFYRTGDLVRRVPMLNATTLRIKFLGRKDQLFKICGVRVDPIEIGNQVGKKLTKILKINSTIVVFISLQTIDENKTKLVAFIQGLTSHKIVRNKFIPKGEKEANNDCTQLPNQIIEKLKEELSGCLPASLIPQEYLQLEKVPITLNGKINHKKLALIFFEWYAQRSLLMTTSINNVTPKVAEICETLVNVWQDVLQTKIKNVSLEQAENFFILGGHSLLLFALKNKINAKFPVWPEISVSELLQHTTLAKQIQLITSRKKSTMNSKDDSQDVFTSDIISLLRSPQLSNENKILNVYCIHAIGGTFYPYYLMMQIFPTNCRVFGIRYEQKYGFQTLNNLAEFYANQILLNQQKYSNQRFLLLGHSLGGILAREIAIYINKWKNDSLFIPFIVALDSWTVGTESLDLKVVQTYLSEQFNLMPNFDELLRGGMQLAAMLKVFKFQKSNVGVCLFKAKFVDNSTIRNSIRKNLNVATLAEIEDNGWTEFVVDNTVEVYLCEGGHDSILRIENLAPFQDLFETFSKKLLCQQ